MCRLPPAAEQAAHPKSGPRRRPHELPGSLVTDRDSEGATHTNRPPRFSVRFSPDRRAFESARRAERPRPIHHRRKPQARSVRRSRASQRRLLHPSQVALRFVPLWRQTPSVMATTRTLAACLLTFLLTSEGRTREKDWRRRPDLNRGWRFCSVLRDVWPVRWTTLDPRTGPDRVPGGGPAWTLDRLILS